MYRGVKDNAWHFFSPGITLEEYEKSSTLEICTYSPLLGHMDLMDSPGSGANDADDSVAEDALKQAELERINMEVELRRYAEKEEEDFEE